MASRRVSEPAEGAAWKPPHGYSNTVFWDGSAVVKRFSPERLDAYRVEQAVVTRLADLIPLPRVLPGAADLELKFEYIDGINGQPLLNSGRAKRILKELGGFLKVLQAIDSSVLSDVLPGNGDVIVHGDYCHYNVLMAHDESRLLAVVDWEVAHLGSRHEDIAWAEWAFRMWYSHHIEHLPLMFQAYGSTPNWPRRHEAMLARCHQLLDEAASDHRTESIENWRNLIVKTEALERVV